MTRAEKFKEVFDLKIDVENADCGFFDCSDIKSCASCPVSYTQFWWNCEYEVPTVDTIPIQSVKDAITEINGYADKCTNDTLKVAYMTSLEAIQRYTKVGE